VAAILGTNVVVADREHDSARPTGFEAAVFLSVGASVVVDRFNHKTSTAPPCALAFVGDATLVVATTAVGTWWFEKNRRWAAKTDVDPAPELPGNPTDGLNVAGIGDGVFSVLKVGRTLAEHPHLWTVDNGSVRYRYDLLAKAKVTASAFAGGGRAIIAGVDDASEPLVFPACGPGSDDKEASTDVLVVKSFAIAPIQRVHPRGDWLLVERSNEVRLYEFNVDRYIQGLCS
jgi:hypothetical protein